MELKTVYLKRVKNELGCKFVHVFEDKECTKLKGIFSSLTSSLPNKRRKIIILNCFKYKVEWI